MLHFHGDVYMHINVGQIIYCLRQKSPVPRRRWTFGKQQDGEYLVFSFIVSFYCPKSTENRTAVIVIHVNRCVSKVIATKTKVILHSFV